MDPDNLSKETLKAYGEDSRFWRVLYFILGLSRSDKHRTLYNAVRPFTVLGGVSDEEVMFLQNARGPYAKTALCFMWLQEFISRETLRGSTGKINGAILSRLFQYQSDGMVGYNQARKITYVRKCTNSILRVPEMEVEELAETLLCTQILYVDQITHGLQRLQHFHLSMPRSLHFSVYPSSLCFPFCITPLSTGCGSPAF